MKKIIVLVTGIFLLSMSATATISGLELQHSHTTTAIITTGSFSGTLGPRPHGNITVGTCNGTYNLRNRGGRFIGDWNLSFQNKSLSGTMKGLFLRHFIVGRITVAGTDRKAPIIGFLRARDGTFAGRAMAPVGPALFFWGTYS